MADETGIAIAEALDDRYIAFVAGGRTAPAGAGNVVVFWDCVNEKQVASFDFYEQVNGLRVCGKWMVVVLTDRTCVFEYHESRTKQLLSPPPEEGSDDDEIETRVEDDGTELLKGPNRVKSLHQTSSNAFALACLRNDLLVLPAQTTGQVNSYLFHQAPNVFFALTIPHSDAWPSRSTGECLLQLPNKGR